jgi:large subunit ribosomal protein L16
MAMMPKRIKFRKQQRGKLRGEATRGNYVAFGEFGLQALEPHWLSARQIDAGRIAAQHFLRRQGKVFIRVFPASSRARSSSRSRACPRTSPGRRWPASPTRCRCGAASSAAASRCDPPDATGTPTMNAKEVRKLSDEEIVVETARLRRRLLDLRSQAVTEKISDNSQFSKSRKDIARLLTEASRRRKEASAR